METSGWIQLTIFLIALALVTKPMGLYLMHVLDANGRTWLDMRGLPGTESLRVTERFSRPRIGRMDIAVTIEDPKAYTKPWTAKLQWALQVDTDLLEYVCLEGERDSAHMVGK